MTHYRLPAELEAQNRQQVPLEEFGCELIHEGAASVDSVQQQSA